MTLFAFDTLELVKELETAGFPPGQAEAQTRILTRLLNRVEEARLDEMAKKQDLTLVQINLKKDIKELDNKIETVRAELKRDIVELDNKMETRFKELETKMETRFKELETKMETRFKELDTKMETRFKELELSTKKDIAETVAHAKVETIRWMVATAIVIMGGTTTLIRLLPPAPVYIQSPMAISAPAAQPATMPSQILPKSPAVPPGK